MSNLITDKCTSDTPSQPSRIREPGGATPRKTYEILIAPGGRFLF